MLLLGQQRQRTCSGLTPPRLSANRRRRRARIVARGTAAPPFAARSGGAGRRSVGNSPLALGRPGDNSTPGIRNQLRRWGVSRPLRRHSNAHVVGTRIGELFPQLADLAEPVSPSCVRSPRNRTIMAWPAPSAGQRRGSGEISTRPASADGRSCSPRRIHHVAGHHHHCRRSWSSGHHFIRASASSARAAVPRSHVRPFRLEYDAERRGHAHPGVATAAQPDA